MTLLALLQAVPLELWVPIAVAIVACLAIAIWYARVRIRQRDAVAPIVAGLVALGAGIGLTTLVITTTLVTFAVGLSQRSTPSPALLLELANGVARVHAVTEGDSSSMAQHLSLVDAGDRRVAWVVLAYLPCTTRANCRVVHGDRLTPFSAAMVVHALARAEDARGAPRNLAGGVVVAVPVPVRDVTGVPIARLLIGFDARPIVRLARWTAWGTLAFALCFWLLLVNGTQWAVSQSVSERLRTLTATLAADNGSRVEGAAPLGDLAALATAIDLAGARAARRESQFRTVFEQVPAGIAWCAEDGRVGAANPHLRRVLGLDAGAPMPAWDSVFVEPEAYARFLEVLQTRQTVPHVSWRWRNADGRERLVRGAVAALPNPTSDAAAVLLVEDESERHALEAQLRRAQKMDAVGKLAGGIAHDFNNLLTIIRASASMISFSHDVPELGAIDDAAARGGRLVRRLLSITRDEAPQTAPEQIGRLLHETIALVRRVFPERVRIAAPVEAPAVLVALDHDAVQQALLNLLMNARDAITGDGVVTLGVREEFMAPSEHWLVVSVADTGDGMSAEVLDRATEPFYTTKSADLGSGLGLSVVYGTMERHGGRFELRSEVGTGTHAELWFPVAEAAAPTGLPESPTDIATESPPVHAHVLLVDDEFAVRNATQMTLRVLGHEVTSVANIDEAERVLASDSQIGLVVSDMMMPGGSGLDLLRRVRAGGNMVPFLIVSGYSVESLEGALGTDPALGVLAKPWTVADLEARVQWALRGAATR